MSGSNYTEGSYDYVSTGDYVVPKPVGDPLHPVFLWGPIAFHDCGVALKRLMRPGFC